MTRSPRLGRLAPGLILLLVTCGRTELDNPLEDDGGLTGAAGQGVSGRDGGQAGASGGRGGGVSAGADGGAGRGGAGGTVGGRGGTGGGGRGGTGGGGRGGTGGGGRGGTGGSVGGRGGTGVAGMGGRGGTGGSVGGRGGTGVAGMGGRGGAGGSLGGRGGSAGTTGTPIPIPCGGDVCIPGLESCCSPGGGAAMCIGPNDTCSGVNIGCLEGAACPSGTFCCGSIVGSATSCVTPATCTFAGGFVLCTNNAQCPSTAPNCCRLGQTGICRALACP